ncbi:MAG: iron-containing alcohol dehydrogenase, partial [bacterium]
IDQGVFNHPQVIKALDDVKKVVLTRDIYKNVSVEPDYDYLEDFKRQFVGKTYDCLIGIGGGSTLDLAKGIAVLLTNKGEAISFRGFPELKNRPLPVIALPTTAGTGSEVTYNAVFTDSKQKKKLGINSILNFPVCAIIDPLLTVNCPKSVTVSSGCDALVHTLESYVHKNHTIISRMYSIEAFRLLFNGLMKVLDYPNNVEIRGDIALGAYFAGTALINAGSGPSGAFSYPLGAVYKVPHGYAGAMFLPSITKINVEKGYRDYVKLYDLIEGADLNLSIEQKNMEFVKMIDCLMDKLEVPRKLSDYNLTSSDIQFMIDQYDVLKPAIDQNPVEITKDDVRKMMLEVA